MSHAAKFTGRNMMLYRLKGNYDQYANVFYDATLNAIFLCNENH